MFADLLTALTLLTRLPVGRLQRSDATSDLARAVWAFPVVGLLVGASGGLAYWAGYRLGLPPLLTAAWTFGVTLILTGAFHEDGLADVADGYGGGRTAERKLEIMRDSRIGSYGTLALAWSALVRVVGVASVSRPEVALIMLVAAGAVGRAGMIVPLLALRPARADGMAASMDRLPGWSAALGLAIAALSAFLLLPAGTAVAVLGAALVAGLAMAWLARRQVGGHTGDVLGATEVVVECVVLTALAALLR